VKVLLVNKFFFVKGGAERIFFQERQFLRDRGVEVVDFSMHHPGNYPSKYTSHFVSPIDYYGSSGLLDQLKQGIKLIHSREAVSKIRRLVRIEKPSIAHLYNVYHQLTPAIIPALKEEGVKVVLTLHDGKIMCPAYLMISRGQPCTRCADGSFWRCGVQNCNTSPIRSILLSVEAYWHKWAGSYRGVDLFLPSSVFYRKLLRNQMPGAQVRVLRNGIEVESIIPSSDDEGYILFFGRLSREKGVETLLKAHRRLPQSVPLKIMGTGPMETKLRQRYPNAEFLGHKEGSTLREIIARAAFVVVPSEWFENCSMVILEAMALGKAVIGSRIGGIPEQVEDGVTGLLFEAGNVGDLKAKMESLIGSPERRATMGVAARRKAEREYSYDSHGKQLLDIFSSLL
jgi:glycosyltransferase involved in cell wall biosynthesis